MKKRLLSLALTLVLCQGLLAVPVSAASATMTEIVSEDTYERFLDGYKYSIRDFHEGITWHGSLSGRFYGAFDSTGKIIVEPCTYYEVKEFSDGVAWAARDNMWYAVDQNGYELFGINYKDIGGEYNLNNFHDGLARIYDQETKAYGYVDKTGKVVIPFEHNERAGDFHDGLAVVYDSANAFFGYMDKTGKVVIPCQYSAAKDFENGFGAVMQGRRWTLIDTTGRELIPQEYEIRDGGLSCTPEVARVYQSGSGYAFVNKFGQIVSGGYGETGPFADGMAWVKQGDKYGFVNESGVLVIPCTLQATTDFLDGYAIESTDGNGARNIIDKTGRVTAVISSDIGLYLTHAGNGCFRIRSSESGRTRYGFIDYTGREIVPCKYALVGQEGIWGTNNLDFLPFSGGVAAVKDFDGKWGFVDTSGTEIVPCQYQEINYTSEPGVFEAVGESNGGTSILKSSGWTKY